MPALHINKNQFQKEVLEHKGVVLVDFYAEWCEPCKSMSPIIDQLSEEKKEIKFIKIDVEENQELASQYSVFTIPTFLVFKEGKMVYQFVVPQSKESFIEELNKIQ
jgi:thioredoxin 1